MFGMRFGVFAVRLVRWALLTKPEPGRQSDGRRLLTMDDAPLEFRRGGDGPGHQAKAQSVRRLSGGGRGVDQAATGLAVSTRPVSLAPSTRMACPGLQRLRCEASGGLAERKRFDYSPWVSSGVENNTSLKTIA